MPTARDFTFANDGLSADQRREFGVVMREAMTSHGWDVQDLARRLNLRVSFIDALAQGRGDEHMDSIYEWSHIRTIAHLLEIELGNLA